MRVGTQFFFKIVRDAVKVRVRRHVDVSAFVAGFGIGCLVAINGVGQCVVGRYVAAVFPICISRHSFAARPVSIVVARVACSQVGGHVASLNILKIRVV